MRRDLTMAQSGDGGGIIPRLPVILAKSPRIRLRGRAHRANRGPLRQRDLIAPRFSPESPDHPDLPT
jgi:hypothetical protein